MNLATVRLALTLARREMRSGLGGFRLFIACLALGVGAIAAILSFSRAVEEGLRADAREILGGDVAVSVLYRDATPEQIAFMATQGELTHWVDSRTMAHPVKDDGRAALVQLKAVEPGYPLYGQVELQGGGSLADALAQMPLDQFFSDGYSFLVEMLFVAHRRGLRIAEVPITFVERLIPDHQSGIEAALRTLVDDERCHLVLTTGGTGPARRDVTPEATLTVASKTMPGFGEQMRQISLNFVPTAILSRQVAVIRELADHACLIINLPGQPKSIRETLEGLRDAQGQLKVAGIFAAVPYCIDLIGGPYLETRDEVCKAFRPKTAIRPPR